MNIKQNNKGKKGTKKHNLYVKRKKKSESNIVSPIIPYSDMRYSYDIPNTISFTHNGEQYSCSSYFPQSDLIESEYTLEYLVSAYYLSEDDIHSVYVENECIGVIIPLSFLMENDTEIIGSIKTFFVKYADLCLRKILNSYLVDKVEDYDFSLEQLYPKDNNLSVFVYQKTKLRNKTLMGYLPSLFDRGYCYVKDAQTKTPLYYSEIMKKEVEERKSSKQVKIKLFYNTDYKKNSSFYDELFINILPYNTNPLFRYIMLYQIIEIFSGYASYNMFVDSSERYCGNHISLNDLRDELHKSTTEKELIKKIYEKINSSGTYFDLFISSVKALFDDIGYDYSNLKNYGQFMYAMRNRIVHETRALTNHIEKMKEIVDIYEKTTMLLLKENDTIKMSSKKVKVLK